MTTPRNTSACFTTNLTDLNNLYWLYAVAVEQAPSSSRTEKAWETYLDYSIRYHHERGMAIQHPPATLPLTKSKDPTE